MLGIVVGGIAAAALLLTAVGMRAMSRNESNRTFFIGWRRMTYGEWTRRRLAPGLTLSVLIVLVGLIVVLR